MKNIIFLITFLFSLPILGGSIVINGDKVYVDGKYVGPLSQWSNGKAITVVSENNKHWINGQLVQAPSEATTNNVGSQQSLNPLYISGGISTAAWLATAFSLRSYGAENPMFWISGTIATMSSLFTLKQVIDKRAK